MKKINLSNAAIINIGRRFFYAFQVIIITLAIPVLAYLELTHSEGNSIQSSAKKESKAISQTPDVTAFNYHL